MQQLLKKIRRTLNDKKNRRQASRVVSSLCCVIVFVTTYAMVLPAITMEQQAQCGIEAHQHYDSCYELQPVCGLEESADHAHTDACYEKVLICGKEAHVHSKACYTDAGKEMLEEVFTAAQDMEQVSAEEAMGAAGGSSETQTADTPAVASGDAQSAGADSAVSGAQGTDPAFSDAQGTDAAAEGTQGAGGTSGDAQGASNSGTASPSPEETAEGMNSDSAGNSAAGDFDEFAPVQPGQADSATDINGDTGEYASEDKSGEAGATDAADTAEISAPAQDAGAGTGAAAEDTNMTEAQEAAAMSEDMPALIFEDTILIQTATATAKQADAETATDAQTGAENQTDAGTSPAQDLLPAETNVTVHVEAEEGTFPAGTSMVLATVQEEALDKVAEAVSNSVEGTSHSFQAVDISFRDASGNEIEPAKPVRVTMTSDAIKTASETPEIAEPVVLHMVDEGAAEDAKDISLQEDSVQFEGESFSIYAVVYTLEYVIETESGIYKVTVTYGPDAKIPEGAALEVTEFSREGEEYTAAREAIIEKLRTEKEDFNESLFDLEAFDITIMGNDGQPIEPEAPVKVLVRMNQLPDNSDEKTLSDTMSIHHLDESTGHTVAETVAEAKDISVGEGAASAEFMVGSFSTFTISWDKTQSISNVSYFYTVSSGTNAWYFDDAGASGGYKTINQNSLYVMGADGLPVTEGVFRANTNEVAKADIYLVYNTTYNSWRVSEASEANSTFHIYFNKNYNGGTYADITVHYVGTDGKRLPRTHTNNVTLTGNIYNTRDQGINLQDYMGTINYYNKSHVEFRGPVYPSKDLTVHYGYMDGNTFKEFDELPEGAQTSYGGPGFVGDQLNVRYDISGKDYVVTMLNDPVNGTPISPLLQTEKNNAFYWRYSNVSQWRYQ